MIVFEIILLLYLGFVVCHNFFFSIVSIGYSEKRFFKSTTKRHHRIVVFLPAYKEDGVIVSSATQAVQHDYPSEFFRVVVIADSMQPSTIDLLKKTGAEIIEVSFERSTKVKALQVALTKLQNFDIAVILDADNVMGAGFLAKINQAFDNGYHCIQGRRVAKNTNTQFAFLDGISESINNQIFRKGYNAIGLSSSLIGSGMAFPFLLLKSHINDMQSVGGFDRELCLRLLNEKEKIHYLESAVVYDEKVTEAAVFANQRRRWLSSQFVYLQRNFSRGVKALMQGNFIFFEAAVLSNILLPRVLMLGILVLVSLAYILLQKYTAIEWIWPAMLLIIYVLALIIAIPRKYFTRHLLIAIVKLPQAFLIMFINLFRLKNANKRFIHTPHSDTSVKR